eukprot:2573864-Rhodomonas_salina.1
MSTTEYCRRSERKNPGLGSCGCKKAEGEHVRTGGLPVPIDTDIFELYCFVVVIYGGGCCNHRSRPALLKYWRQMCTRQLCCVLLQSWKFVLARGNHRSRPARLKYWRQMCTRQLCC